MPKKSFLYSDVSRRHKSARSILTYQRAERKKDALALAELVYDMFKEKKISDKVENGQNNAQSSKN